MRHGTAGDASPHAMSGRPLPRGTVATTFLAVATLTLGACAGGTPPAAATTTGTSTGSANGLANVGTTTGSANAGTTSGTLANRVTSLGAPSGRSAPASRTRGPVAGAPAPKLPVAQLRQGYSTPVEDPYYPATSNPEVDSLHYGLDLDWDGRTLRGTTQLTFRATVATSRVRLGLIRTLATMAVTLDGRPVPSKRVGDDIVIGTGPLAKHSQHVLVIRYKGLPRSVPAPSSRPDTTEGLGWNRDKAGNVYTFQEPYGAHTWYAVNDHPSDKARYDATIRVPRGRVGVFNGTLTKTEVLRGKTVTRWHLDRPAASYLTTIAIGRYKHSAVKMPDGKPFNIWLMPQHEPMRAAIAKEALRSYTWLLKKAGPYPFATSGIVVVDGDSAMETQTLITAADSVLQSELNGVVLHELAHQWYGDSVGPIDWLAVWLNEGWATRMQFDYEDPRGVMYDVRTLDSMCSWSRVIAGPAGRFDRRQFADDNVYVCSAGMLTELRNKVGVARFDAIAKAWPAQHRDRTVNRATFLKWLNEQTGSDHSGLLRRWLD